jgi:polar amino acid transport system substrate-binding protein
MMRPLNRCYSFGLYLGVVMLLALALNSYAHAETKPLKIAGSVWPPFIVDQGAEKGAATALVSEILKRAGYQTEVSIETWPRTLEGTSAGIYDVIISAWYTKERESHFQFTEPYFVNTIQFVKRKGAPINFRSYQDLKGLVIGVVNGYAYGEEFDNAQGLLKLPSNHLIQNLLKLQQGRIDLTLGDKWVVRNELTEYFPTAIKDFEFLGKPVATRTLHAAVSRAHPQHDKIVKDFNKTLKAMKADGSYEKILDTYRKRLVNLTEAPL